MIPSIFTPVRALLLVTLSVPLVACVYDNDRPHHYSDDPSYGGTPTTPAPTSSASTGTSPAPLLVEVDTDQTMSATPGDGVGVFIEYAKGGYWHVWWTCDTNKTQQSCDYAVNVSTATGAISNVDSGDLTKTSGNTLVQPTDNRVEVQTFTTTQVHSLYFNTDAGAILTVDASLGGLKDGSFLFFVQDGKVNGGYAGRLTNPLQLQGTLP